MIRRMHAIGVVLLLPILAQAAATTTSTSQTTTRPDPHVWAKRNVDLIREATTRAVDAKDSDDIESILDFSLSYNPLLATDPYAGQVLKLLEDLLARENLHPDVREALDSPIEALRRPREQRAPRSRDQREAMEALDREQRQAARRRDGEWAELAGDYYGSAQEAWQRKRPAEAKANLDRFIALLRERPPANDSKMTDLLQNGAFGIAALFTEMGRATDLDALMPSLPESLRLELLLGYTRVQIEKGHDEQARQIIENQVRPMAPAVADYVVTALKGEFPQPPPRPTAATTTTRPGASQSNIRPPRLNDVLYTIAHARAKRGDVALAIRQIEQRAAPQPPAAHEVALIAKLAAEGGNTAVSTALFERAVELEKNEPMTPAEYEEKAGFVREAVKLGMFDWAYGMLSTTADPGARVRHALARAYRARGDTARSEALLAEAIRLGHRGRGEGHILADIAVDLHADGQRERAEQLLIDAIDHIEGIDFGFSGTAAIVSAAMKMNRLDLLDRCYESYDSPGEKMLLCIVATRTGLYGDAMKDDD